MPIGSVITIMSWIHMLGGIAVHASTLNINVFNAAIDMRRMEI